jgi:hypothetical protein
MRLGCDDPMIGLVLHVHREVLHHGAEINLLRDLYAADRPVDPLLAAVLGGDRPRAEAVLAADPSALERLREVEPALVLRATETGRAEAVELAIGLGFDLDAMDAMSALHHATAAGDLALVRLLLRRGADPTVADPRFRETPFDWASRFQRPDIARLLQSSGA